MPKSEENPASAVGVPDGQPVAQEPVQTNKKYIVKTPWSVDLLLGQGTFPDITPHGVGMTEAELEQAQKAASSLYLRLDVEEAN